MIQKDDIYALAELARISLTEEQAVKYQTSFESILGYIDTINSVTLHQESRSTEVLKNIMREDTESYAPGEFTTTLLENAPAKQDGYIVVDKVL